MEPVPPDAEALLAHSDFLRALARGLLRDEDRVADVVQETWVAAIEHPPRDPSGLRGWLATVALNLARRARRDERRRALRVPPEPPGIPTPEEILAREETRRRVVLAVLDLAEPYRTTVILRFLEELPPREVARRLGVKVETVRTRTKRALARLREKLDGEYGERKTWSLALLPLALPRRAAGPLLGALLVDTKAKLLAAAALCALAALLWSWRASSAPAADVPRTTQRAGAGTTAREAAPAGAAAVAAPVAEAVPAYPEGTTIAGRVVADGVPLEGAYVCLTRGKDLVARVEATDAFGRFAFAEAGTFTIAAAHPQRRPARMEVTAVAGERRDVEIELPAAPSVGVLVLDARTDLPVAGAEILVLRSGKPGASFNIALQQTIERESDLTVLAGKYDVFNLPEWFSALKGDEMLFVPLVRTDARGRARVGGLIDREFDAIVTHDAYPAVHVTCDGKTEEMVVRLEPGAALTVVAPRLGGVPLAGHVCELDRPGLIPMPVRRGVLDDLGRAAFAGLRTGTYVLSISKDGLWKITCSSGEEEDEEGNPRITHKVNVGRSGTVLLTRQVDVRAGADQVLDLSSTEGARVTGRIETQSDAKEAWIVRLMEGPGFERTAGETHPDAEGRFTFERVAPGSYLVVATGVLGGGPEITAPCEVRAAEGVVEVVLQAGTGALFGTVLGPTGIPLPKATVFVLPDDGRLRDVARREPRTLDDLITLLVAHAESGEDGEFEMPELSPQAYSVFCASGSRLGHATLRLAAGERQRVDFRLDDNNLFPATIRLAGPEGRPVKGTVRLRGEEGGFLVAVAVEAERPGQEATDPFLYHLARGRYRVDAFGEDLAPRFDRLIEVEGPEDTAIVLEAGAALTLLIESGNGALSGHEVDLVDESGFRVRGDAFRDPVLATPPRTDASGRVVFPHIVPGKYTVRVDGREQGTVEMGSGPAERKVGLGPQ